MSGASAALPLPSVKPGPVQTGRSFIHPVFDYLLIGGGLSLVGIPGLKYLMENLPQDVSSFSFPALILLSNSAHFAASTVRLYTKPGAFRQLPFLTMGFPIVMFAVVTLAIVFSSAVGKHLQSLYLTWSPYHYAAQAYGIALIYSYRSGCNLEPGTKSLLRATCMLPFMYAFLTGTGVGINWFVSESVYLSYPMLDTLRMWLARGLAVLTFLMPLILLYRIYVRDQLSFPAISLLLILTNGIWWIVLPFMQAFVWATIFHGIQYIAIVTIFHVKDKKAEPQNTRGTLYHTLFFYAMCLGLGYALFNVLPWGYVRAGFSLTESMLLVTAAINIHHFIVDRYIWRLKSDRNYKIVVSEAEQAL